MSSAPAFTVFTATYQRAHTLHRVHQSLAAQTTRDFEWLVVDGRSTDGTQELVESWAAASDFPIRYLEQENEGKHGAWNTGVRAANSDLFLSLDSDDECVPEALERLLALWHEIPEADRGRYSGVTVHCIDRDGNLVGDRFPADRIDGTSLDLRYRWRVTGDKWGFVRTAVLAEFPFPETPGVRFVTEVVVWDRIGRRYVTRFANEALKIYDESPDEGRLTMQIKRPGALVDMFVEAHAEQLNDHLDYARHAPLEYVRVSALYTRDSLLAGRGLRRQVATLRPKAWPLWLIGAPVGAAAYARDRLRLRRATS